jgi:predicted DNA-binding transcriptional regulator AlpA
MQSVNGSARAAVPFVEKRGITMNNTPAIVAELLPLAQAAKLCGLGERTFWRYAHNGTAPAPVKIGGSSRYRRSDLLEWISAGCPRCDSQNSQSVEATDECAR